MATFTVATWNTQSIRGASDAKLERVADAVGRHRLDVLALQEISSRSDTFARLLPLLRAKGLTYATFSGESTGSAGESQRHKGYGNVIASRWPLTPVPWPVPTTWPQLIAAGDVRLPGHLLRVVSVHIPNGSGNGWQKVYALEALHQGLLQTPSNCMVMGDFNEPRAFTPVLRSFRADVDGAADGQWTDKFGQRLARRRWQDAVMALFGPESDPGLGRWPGRLATGQVGVDDEATHVLANGSPRYFDHILTTAPIAVTDLTYDHEVRLGPAPISDHSMVIATVNLPEKASRRTDVVGAVETPYGRVVWREGPLTDSSRIVLEINQAGDAAEETVLLGGLVAHINGAVLKYLP